MLETVAASRDEAGAPREWRLLLACRRILVVGSTCAGKTTTCRKISESLKLNYTDLDDLWWLPKWQPRPIEEFLAKVKATVTRDYWVIGGNYTSSQKLTWSRCDAVVWLDMPLPLVLYRVLKRSATRFVTREKFCNGNVERPLALLNPRKSLIVWALTTHKRRSRWFEAQFANPQGRLMIRLRGPREAKRFLAYLRAVHLK
ncbi:adenylate kinase [Fimbriimonadia bacterium ATM]|nr:MAG: adenylate kinase [Armatimonadota bacterium]MBC6970614.1 adenylate kinase [Armatimonadota bacterium]MCE7899479.1 adenylate kinase [Armatimonadetes bacterium ATM1]MDL1929744.1 adenylate kinase [Fimbriimonadia bacterium ATM]RIJ96502.1 MAG: adenylate kinase [Armatimonadota bacterium]